MTEFEEIFSRPWSCRTMPCSWTIKTKSNGVLLGRSNEHKCPLWRMQIVPSLRPLSSLDLKEEKSYRQPSSSLLFSVFSCTVPFSLRGFSHSYFSFCPSNFLLTFFRFYLFQLDMIADGMKHHLGLSSPVYFPVSRCTSHSLLACNEPRFIAHLF